MQGSKRQIKPGVWELRVYLGRDPVTKRRRDISRTFRGGVRAANSELARMVTEAETERRPGTESTFGYLLTRWLDLIEPERSPTTIKEYRRLVEKRIRPALGDVPVRLLTAEHLDSMYAELRRSGLGPASIIQVHAICRRALEQAVRWDWVADNVARKAQKPKRRNTELVPPDVADLWAIMDACPSAQLRAAFWLAGSTGARRGELCGLRWPDVDLERGTLKIHRAVIRVDGVTHAKDTKTHAARVVHLDELSVLELRAHSVAQVELAERAGYGVRVDGYVFSLTPSCSEPLKPDYLTKSFTRVRTAAGVADTVHLHSMRHLQASLLLAEGVDVVEVAARLGHAQTSMTHNTYAHLIPGREGRAPAALARALQRPA